MIDMSDDEADTIVVAMSAPNGPLGDSFEVDVAAGASRPNSHAKTPRKRKPATRRKPTTKGPSVATHKIKSASSTNGPAPSAKSKRTTYNSRNDSSSDSVPHSHSSSPSLATAATSKSATSTANTTPTNRNSSIANAAAIAAAQNTRFVRFKNQLCTLWDIDQAELNATFNTAYIVDGPLSPSKSLQEPPSSPSKSWKTLTATRSFFAKLAHMAQTTEVGFDVAKAELERAREQRLKSGAEGTSGTEEEDGRSKDKTFLWVPDDVDRAMEVITNARARTGVAVSKKRTASQAGASEEQARASPAERERMQAKETESGVQTQATAQKGRPPPLDVRNGLVGERTQGLLTPTDEMDTCSERASVPRASSIEAMIEAQHSDTPQVPPVESQPRPQPVVVIGPARAQATTPLQAPPETPELRPPLQLEKKGLTGTTPAQSTAAQARPAQPQPQLQRQVVDGSAQTEVIPSKTQPSQHQPESQPDPKTKEVTGAMGAQWTPSQPQREMVNSPAPATASSTQPAKPQQHQPAAKMTGDSGVVPGQSKAQPEPISSRATPATESQTHSGPSPKAATPAARTDQVPSQQHPQAAAVSDTTRPTSTPSQTPFQPPPVEVPARREQSIPLPAPSSPALSQSESPGGAGTRKASDPCSTRQRMDLSTMTNPTAPHTEVGPARPSTASPTLPRPQPLPQPVSNGVASSSPVSGAAEMDRRMSEGTIWRGAGQYGVVSKGTVSNGTVSNNWVPNSPRTNAPMPNAPTSNSPISNAPMAGAPISNSPRTKTPLSSIPMFNPPGSNSPVQRSPVSNAPASNSPGWNATVPNGTSSNGATSNSTASSGVPNGIVSSGSNSSAQRTVGPVQAGGQSAGSKQDKGEGALPRALAGDHAEALRRLENDQALPPPIFNHILQMYCSISASHVAVSPITATAKTCSQLSFLLSQYKIILVPFYIDDSWSLATLNLESKTMVICGPRAEQVKTESAAINFFNASIDGADHTTWEKTYITLGPPTNYWDQPIVCLVAAIHMFCGLDLQDWNPNPTIWRTVLAILLKGLTPGSDLAPRPTNNRTNQDADVDPANFTVPAPCCPLSIKNYLAHMSKSLTAFHACYQERLTEVRSLATHGSHACTLFIRLIDPRMISDQRNVFKTRQAEMQALVEQTENMMQTLTRMKVAIPGSATMNELTRCVEGARGVQAADAARVERLERLFAARELVSGMVSTFVREDEKRERRLAGMWTDLRAQMEGTFESMAEAFGSPRGGSGGGGEKGGNSGANGGGAGAGAGSAAGTAGGTVGGGNGAPRTHWATPWRPTK